MLNEYMKSDEYVEMIDSTTDRDDSFNASKKKFLDELYKAKLDKETHDSIDSAAFFMRLIAQDTTYKKGFQDGIRLIMECMSSGTKGGAGL